MNDFKVLSLSFIIAISGICNAQTTEDTLFATEIETPPEFPNGYAGWRNFLFNNLHENVPLEYGAPSGRYTVIVGFTIDKEGTLSDIKPLTNFGYGMEEEVIRLMLKSGKWKPGMQSGKFVRCQFKQPITFFLRPENIDFNLNNQGENYVLSAEKENILTVNTSNSVGKKDNNLEVRTDKGIIKK